MFGVPSTPSSSSRSSSTVASSSSRWKTSVSLLSMPVTVDILRCIFPLSDAQLSRQRGSSSASNLSNKSLQRACVVNSLDGPYAPPPPPLLPCLFASKCANSTRNTDATSAALCLGVDPSGNRMTRFERSVKPPQLQPGQTFAAPPMMAPSEASYTSMSYDSLQHDGARQLFPWLEDGTASSAALGRARTSQR